MSSERFTLAYGDTEHVATVSRERLKFVVIWQIDGTEVASKSSMGSEFAVNLGDTADGKDKDKAKKDRGQKEQTPRDDDKLVDEPELRCNGGMLSVHRVTLVSGGDSIDLIPDDGTPAARRELRMRDHPTLYTAIMTGVAVAKIVIPLILAGLVFVIPWPNLNLPSIPTLEINLDLDLPSVPLPNIDLPDINVPDWLKPILENLNYIIPVILAFVLARTEVRRRKQDENRAHQHPTGSAAGARAKSTDADGPAAAASGDSPAVGDESSESGSRSQ